MMSSGNVVTVGEALSGAIGVVDRLRMPKRARSAGGIDRPLGQVESIS